MNNDFVTYHDGIVFLLLWDPHSSASNLTCIFILDLHVYQFDSNGIEIATCTVITQTHTHIDIHTYIQKIFPVARSMKKR